MRCSAMDRSLQKRALTVRVPLIPLSSTTLQYDCYLNLFYHRRDGRHFIILMSSDALVSIAEWNVVL